VRVRGLEQLRHSEKQIGRLLRRECLARVEQIQHLRQHHGALGRVELRILEHARLLHDETLAHISPQGHILLIVLILAMLLARHAAEETADRQGLLKQQYLALASVKAQR